MKKCLRFAIVSLLAVSAICLRAEQTDPKPAAPAVAPNGNEMPLPLFKKLKTHFDHLAGIPANLLPGVPIPTKAEVEKDLAKEADANKDTLIKSLTSSQSIQREISALTLQYITDQATALPALTKSLASDADENVRRDSAFALGKFKDAAAGDALIKSLSDNDDSVRAISAIGLGNLKDTRATEALMKSLDSDSAALVRLQSAQALRKLNDPKSLDTLKKVLGTEKDEHVLTVVAAAVRSMMGANAPKELAEVPTPEQQSGQLTKLSKDMKNVENLLRDDRHDQVVQVEGAKIEKSLAELIERLSKG